VKDHTPTFEVEFAVSYGTTPLLASDLTGLREKSATRLSKAEARSPLLEVPESSSVHAPKFPEEDLDHTWWVMLVHETNFLAMVVEVKEPVSSSGDTFVMRVGQEVEWLKEGETTFTLWILSDSYVGAQASMQVQVRISLKLQNLICY